MKLKTYLKKQKIESLNQWCLDNDLSFATIQRHLDQVKAVRPDTATKIERATGGQVSRMELLYPEE